MNKMENPYEAPKSSSLSIGSSELFSEGLYFRQKILPAFAIVFAVQVAMAWLTLLGDVDRGALYSITASLSQFVGVSYSMWLLHKMSNGKMVAGKPQYFGVWALIWRAYVLYFLSGLAFAGFYWAFRHSAEPMQASVEANFVYAIAIFVVAPLITWVLFSKDRRGQLYWASQILGGA